MNQWSDRVPLWGHLGVLLLFCVTLVSCGGGGSSASPPTQSGNSRALQFDAQYKTGPLSFPGGEPDFLKTIIGDLNGDGRNDVVTFTNATVNGSDVVVTYQDQGGSFTFFLAINSISDLGMSSVQDIAIGDFNGDGRADLAIMGNPIPVPIGNGHQLVVLYQDSTGNLGSLVQYVITRASLSLGNQMAIGDLNGDGRTDLVFSGSPARIMLQDSNGNLADTASIFTIGATILGEVRVADMDADGDNDIVYQAADVTIAVLRQVAPGIFSAAPDLYPVVTNIAFNTFAVGDVNGDGKNDVVVLGPGNNAFLNIFLQNGSGTLNPPVLLPISFNGLYGIEIADINGDGLNDILGNVTLIGGGQIHVFYERANNTFQDSTVYQFPTCSGGGPSASQSLSVGDVTGDGWPDAVVSCNVEGIFVLRNVSQ